MTKTVEFYFDFGSPNAYLAYKRLPAILERTGAEVAWRPMLLGGVFKATGNQSPVAIAAKRPNSRNDLIRFTNRHGVPFAMNPHFPVNTLQLMRGAVAAEIDGALPLYVEAAFHHMWEEPKKMDDPEVIQAALCASGLDGPRILERIQDPVVKERLRRNSEQSVARGTFGVPTFFVGGHIHFGKDRLRDVEEAILDSGNAVRRG